MTKAHTLQDLSIDTLDFLWPLDEREERETLSIIRQELHDETIQPDEALQDNSFQSVKKKVNNIPRHLYR